MENNSACTLNKEQKIQNLKRLLSLGNSLPRQQYNINTQLYKEYKKYQTDSAISYVIKNQKIADKLGSEELKQETLIQLAYLHCARGMYIESQNILESISKSKLSTRLLPYYYDTYETFCSSYGQSNNNAEYYKKSELYRDSLLSVLNKQSLQYRIAYAAKLLYSYQQVKPLLLSLLTEATGKDRGLVAYFLGYYYQMEHDLELSEKYYIISAISDVENCVKDNASLRALALIYYEKGDINKAHKFMQAAIDDAIFCNVRYRTIEISSSYPIINASYQEKEKNQKNTLQILLIIISLLVVFLAVGLIYIYRQMKRLAMIRKELYRTNLQLGQLNKDLFVANDSLKESNFIKEEYIAHFFDLCSTYIDKLENYRKMLNKHASNRQIDELVKILHSTTLVETELEELYKKFDVIFLNLYPSFVEEFNALQIKEEQVLLKRGELLNTELRIFALIRLGITDSVKIAGFLRYSISTIYNYRVKARNNAVVPREQFEEMVIKIGNITLKNESSES
ncbi:MAG: DUF6377 domain-containing protein [Paludibacter sp.]|nr:DUF6377 domain-containing protein [Paludibacter sp.]